MTSVIPTLVVNQKPQNRFSTKGEINKELLCLSRGYPTHLTILTNWTLIVEKGGCSCHSNLPQPTQHPHHHLVTYETVDNQSLDGLLKSATAVEMSPQDANMVRLAHDRCHTRAISRVWVAPDTYGHLHPQRARILFRVCPMIHIGCT